MAIAKGGNLFSSKKDPLAHNAHTTQLRKARGVDGEGGEGYAKSGEEEAGAALSSAAAAAAAAADESGDGSKKPVILVTNGDGIGSPGLTALVEALVRGGQCDVHVCAPES